ncbi:hypothetical protein LQZ19_15580 [Treponema primitia]|uniref:hypothetical protein n=1 Tax=Treponema primitia TaxID=88058 RepID=UPI00397EACBF
MNQLDNLIREIINSIPGKHIFDTHMVIQKLIQKYTNDYLVNAQPFSTIESYHGHIGKSIVKYQNILVEDLGVAYSKNIKDDFSECECWRKI